MLIRTLRRFEPLDLTDNAIIVVPPGETRTFSAVLTGTFPHSSFVLVEGGAERQLSVAKGLDQLAPGMDMVVIHDAARPFVSTACVLAAIEAGWAHGAATVAVPCSDTILKGDDEDFLVETPERKGLWACQTPQVFRIDVIRQAHEAARRDGFIGTDDASLVRRIGHPVKLVRGSPTNLKITTPADLDWAMCMLERGTE